VNSSLKIATNLKNMDNKFINTEYIESVTGGDKEIVVELVDIFRSQVTEIANEMKVLNSKGDFHTLGLLAHKAKSSVAIMGMNDLAVMLKTFEMEGKEGKNKENYESYIKRYETEAGLAVLELENYVNNL
jgi:HPt (histidine-containing phosphotransfer) domain-containing protein